VVVLVNLYNDDCFNVLKTLPAESVDLVLTDPPYGTTAIKWDKVLDFNKMWIELERVTKPKSNIILFASQPFTSLLITSKLDWFRYELIWNKNKCGSPGLAKKRPQKVHENILIFSKESGGVYNPIMEKGDPYTRYNPDGYGSGKNTHGYGLVIINLLVVLIVERDIQKVFYTHQETFQHNKQYIQHKNLLMY